MHVRTEFAQQAQFLAAVGRAARPHAVELAFTLGDDWSGEPAVFLMVILSNAASQRDQLPRASDLVTKTIVQLVQPLEQWSVLPYLNFRSEADQAQINHQSLAS